MKHHFRGWIIVAAALALGAWASVSFARQAKIPALDPGPGVARITLLSDYVPGLKGTAGDTPVYFIESGQPGATVLIVGGTHADEAAGHLTAALWVRRAVAKAGRCILIPWANRSGFTHNLPMEGHPAGYAIGMGTSAADFKYGARLTNPIHQWPDPSVFVDPASRQQLAGTEARNLNRAYPGKPNGTLTQQVAYGIVSLITKEKVDVAIDLHESSPEYPTINTIVVHERAQEVGAIASMTLQAEGLNMGLELSPQNLRGLSHREWGDNTETLAFLIETPNPSQGRLRGATTPALVTSGRDAMYLRLASSGRLHIDYTARGVPSAERVGRHTQAILAIMDAFNILNPERTFRVEGVPAYTNIVKGGLTRFFE